MVQIARDAERDSFLTDSRVGVEIVLGDARLIIAEEQIRDGSPEYDFLGIDGFNVDQGDTLQ